MNQSRPQVPFADRGTSGTTRDAHDASPSAVRPTAHRIQLGALASDREILMLGRRAFERGDDEVAREIVHLLDLARSDLVGVRDREPAARDRQRVPACSTRSALRSVLAHRSSPKSRIALPRAILSI